MLALIFGALHGMTVADLPATLRETGYESDEKLEFEPQYPLWSDGAHKRRWIYLPSNSQIDTSDMNAWVYPIGTKFWKEFQLADPESHIYKKVETRFLEKTSKGWIFATYLWNEDQTEALRANEYGHHDYRALAPGKFYNIPAVYECNSCHGYSGEPVLGFSALQLSPNRDRPHQGLDLQKLVEMHAVSSAPKIMPKIPSQSLLERNAIGYLHGNCASCHNPNGAAAFTGLYLNVDALETERAHLNVFSTAVDQSSNFAIPGFEESSFRVKKGSPLQSAVLFRLFSEEPGTLMPPFGRALHDPVATPLIEQWISELVRED